MALGTRPRGVLISFGRRGLGLTLAGLGTGAVLLMVAALACFLPVRRASRIDPVIALQHK